MFRKKNFIFNNTPNTDMDVILVTFDDEQLNTIDVSYSREISSEEYSSSNPMYVINELEPEEIVINLMYVDAFDRPLEWTDEKIMDIKKWLTTDRFVSFVEQDSDYTLYLMCSRIEKRMVLPSMVGVLECTFKPLTSYKYLEYSTSISVSGGTKSLGIENPTIEEYKPIIKITNLGSTSTVNKINSFEITGLAYKEEVTIDNLICTVFNSSGSNKFSSCNRAWVVLKPGYNTLNINGNCVVEILCQFPMPL